jgi:hypothetical protein
MGFKETVLFMLNMVKKSLQIELNNFIETVLLKEISYSKQAYSEARQHIKPELFTDLSDSIIDGFYRECDDYKLWNGYRLTAIDGSKLEIPDTELLRSEFGCSKNASGEVARASASCLFDLLNRLIIRSSIDKCDTPEREAAKLLINRIIGDGIKTLMLFDRGYPSAEFMAYLIDNGIDFLMRAKRNYSNDVKKAKNNQIIEFKKEGKIYRIRVIKFLLETGEEEILLTSLFDKTLTVEDFKKLYFMRWGIEIRYDDLKNKLQIENFTGTTKVAIKQDFYASIYLSNMAEFIMMESTELSNEKKAGKDLKYEYRPNMNVLIGTLKDEFILILMESNTKMRNKKLNILMGKVARSCIPIRPGRHYPRKDTLVNSKYSVNRKKCL